MSEYEFGGISPALTVIWLAVMILEIASMWVLFSKAGKPGWASIIPIYNVFVFLKIGGKPGWWIILMLIPFVNIIIGIIALSAFLKAFGKQGAGPVLLALFFGYIYFPYLAFSKGVRHQGVPA